jgi:exosome complex component RRP43
MVDVSFWRLTGCVILCLTVPQLALPGQDLSSIKTAYSHPQALAQCEGYLTRLGITPEKQYDTAGSAKMIAEKQLRGVAAIASELAAQTYGLQIIARKIEDDPGNYTRFLLLAPSTTAIQQATMYSAPATLAADEAGRPRAGSSVQHSNVANLNFSPALTRTTFKTSLVFTLPDAPGSLFKALSVFALRDLVLCKIESRPCKSINFLQEEQLLSFADMKAALEARETTAGGSSSVAATASESSQQEFKYLFFIDTLSSLSQNESLKNGLRHLKEYAPFLRVLGSYPVFQAMSSSSGEKSLSGVHDRTNSTATSSLLSPSSSGAYRTLKIGILGFGTFGQFLSKTFVRQGHQVYVHSRSDYSALSQSLGVHWVPKQDDLATMGLDVLIISVSILSFAQQIDGFPWEKLKNALIVDVLSVKQHPKTLLLAALATRGDKSLDLLCTHPMFGPQSGGVSWSGLPLMYDRVRVSVSDRCSSFLSCFEREGCRMLEMTCEAHDQYAAGSQFLTHTTGRILGQMKCTSTPINTVGYTKLLQVVEQTQRDSWELYAGLYKYNQQSKEQLQLFENVFQEIKQKLQSTGGGEDASSGNSSSPSGGRIRFNDSASRMHESATVAMADRTKALVSSGIAVTSLSVGEVLSVKTPKVICEAAAAAMAAGHTTYTATAGMIELRKAICEKLQRENHLQYTPDQILVSNGAKQSIYQALAAVLVPGSEDEVIIPAPYWVSYPDMVTLLNGRPVIVDTQATACVLTPEQLEAAITPRTKVLILCTPSNPTGVVYTRDQLSALARVLDRHPQVLVLSDEIYEHLVFAGATHTSFASLPQMASRTLTINGFSKGYVMTGFRVGYLAAPIELVRMCVKIQGQVTSCSSSISQHAALAALTQLPASCRTELVASLDKTRQLLLAELAQIPEVSFQTPTGAFYVMVRVDQYFGRKTEQGRVVHNRSARAHTKREDTAALSQTSRCGPHSCALAPLASLS